MLQLSENKNLNGIIEYGICPLSVIPIRVSPSHRSELISQMLFGEMAEMLEINSALLNYNEKFLEKFVK